ncbi:hypothetical protein Tco_0620381 [Tanacetum coccineum]
MVTVPIHQDSLSVPLMTTPDIDLTVSQPVPIAVQAPLPTLTATATTTTTTLPIPPQPQPSQPQQGSSDFDLNSAHQLYKLENLDIPHRVSKIVDEIVTDAESNSYKAHEDHNRFRDLPEANIKEILHHRIWESNSYKAHKDHKKLYEALEQSMARDHTDQLLTDLAGPSGTSGTSRASGSSQLPPPPPPPSTNQSDQSTSTAAPSSSKTAASAEYTAWTTTNIRLKPSVSSIPEELHMDDDMTPDEQVQSAGDEDIGHDYIPTVNLRKNWWKPLTKDRPATPEPAWSILSSDLPIPVNKWASALTST